MPGNATGGMAAAAGTGIGIGKYCSGTDAL